MTWNFTNSLYPRNFLCEEAIIEEHFSSKNFVKSVRKLYGNPDSHAFFLNVAVKRLKKLYLFKELNLKKAYVIKLVKTLSPCGVYRAVPRVWYRMPRALWHPPFTHFHRCFYPFNLQGGSAESEDRPRTLIRPSLESVFTVNLIINIINYY